LHLVYKKGMPTLLSHYQAFLNNNLASIGQVPAECGARVTAIDVAARINLLFLSHLDVSSCEMDILRFARAADLHLRDARLSRVMQ
jgi:hypothetical protein